MKKTVLILGILLGAMMILAACTDNGDDYNDNGAGDTTEFDEGTPPPVHETYTPEFVEAGDVVSVHYTGRLAANGNVFDSSEGREPLTFVAGAGQMIPGFDAAVLGMALNEEITVEIPAEDAYGEMSFPDPVNPDEYLIPPNSDLIFDIKVVAIERVVQP